MDFTREQRLSIDFATEVAFSHLIMTARKRGLDIGIPVGLNYLPTQEDTERFKQSCTEIITSLMVK